MPNPTYPIAPKILETRERELQSRLPGFYPDPDSLQIAEQILMPQIRSVIAETLSNFNSTRGELALTPPSPAELPALCAEVDKSLDANRDLLDSDGLGKPLFDYVRSVRESVKAEMIEAFKAHCRSLLATHGVTDRTTLLAKRTRWFIQAEFPPFGKGMAFIGLILGETIYNLSLVHLNRIADFLIIPELSEETKCKFRSVLANHGVTDRNSLLAKGTLWFQQTDFTPFGTGQVFAGLILGETVAYPTVACIHRVTDALGLPDLSEETKEGLCSALATHGIVDRVTLFDRGTAWLKSPKAQFPPFGGGHRLLSFTLGETVHDISLGHLGRLADILSLPQFSGSTKKAFLSALAAHGIVDRATLVAKGPTWLKRSDFFPYGKGMAFVGKILGDTVYNLSLGHLQRVADILFPEK